MSLALLNRLFVRRTPVQMVAVGLLLVALVGAGDYASGYEVSFSIFYLLPIVLVTWFAGRRSGYVVCAVSASVWLLVDYTSGHAYSQWLIPIWNALVRLGFFVVTTYLLGESKIHLDREAALSKTDGLTQLLNARAFKEAAQRLLRLAARHHHRAALAYIDVDDFKAINDGWGHAEGDEVLRMVANRLLHSVRASDVVGRLGGDEFAVFMPEMGPLSAQAAFGRMHEALQKAATQRGWPIGFSVGVAVFDDAPPGIDEALQIADRLMYRVKKAGKNQVLYEEQPKSGMPD